MRRRIFPLIMVYLLMSCFIVSAVAIEPKAIIGRPVLKIEGTTAYCSGQYRSGNRNDQISMTITLKLNDKVIKSWSDSGTGSVIISETHTVERGIYTIHIDEEFAKSEDTVYPIHIDPTITINASGSGTNKTIVDAPVYSGLPSTNHGSNIYNRIEIAEPKPFHEQLL